jgi:class 3 adenylate cyclase
MTKILEEWAAQASDKRIVALVITDIVGWTQTCGNISGRERDSILDKHFARARHLINKYQGCEFKTAGDSLMVVFRTADAALNFALFLNKNTGSELVKIRAGIHIGTVRFKYKDNDIEGRMFAYTKRVCDWSADDWVVLSNSAKEDAEAERENPHFFARFEPIESELKSFPKTQTLWHAVSNEIVLMLPFQQIGVKNPGDEHFATRINALISDQILQTLQSTVLSANCIFIKQGEQDCDAELETEADYILSGHFQRRDGKTLFSARLSRARDNSTLWNREDEVEDIR